MKRAVSIMLGAVLALGAVGVEAKSASRSSSSRTATKTTTYKAPVNPVAKPTAKTTKLAVAPKKKKSWGDSLFEDVVQSDKEQELADMLVGCEIEFLPSRKFKVDCDD